MSGRYINSNTYHNYKHGVDVCHTVYRLLSVSQLISALGQLDLFALLVPLPLFYIHTYMNSTT
jgi:hypothetical protein